MSLRELSITGLGVIDQATVEFSSGLTALTGETGAGKTMVTTGIGLLLGERADPGVVRRGARSARVEGRFAGDDLAAGTPVGTLVDDAGGELDDEELLVARQVNEQGRSRAWVGGAQTSATSLAGVTSELVTIHGQSEQVRLGSPERQRLLLDRSCGPEHVAAVAAHQQLYAERQRLVAELDDLRRSSQERAREADLLRFGCDEVSAVAPQPGEDDQLREEARRLQSLDELRLEAGRLTAALSGDPDGSGYDDHASLGASGLLGLARRSATALARLDDQAGGLNERVHDLAGQIDDLAADVARYTDDLAADPARLDAVMARQADLARLTRKYGTTIDEVLAWADDATTRLADLDGSDERIADLEHRLTALDTDLARSAAAITERRATGARVLEQAAGAELAALALPDAQIVFHLEPRTQVGPYGAEQVSLLFSANPGSMPGPLSRVASGGELSRVRLALEVVLADDDPGHTFVFDEVDAGIGGAVALEVGRRLAQLARRSQVIVVTHLAQVAAFADRQVVVAKSSDGQVTTSGLRVVEGTEREQELARMMGGLESADSARAHARDLLDEAGQRLSTRPRS
ncbi:DNA repair protein RecN [Aestuariimicrobium ganziense]|uniref:DNA repair protein RecN n=1 Tax=Aestuariimicrobium ganziense TaxID=2773677 RepID=UPI0019441786|nr:DNA repair protein RecN [Aestuariimicrobium ganziense]